MSISGQIVSEIVAQLYLENSIQTLLIFFWVDPCFWLSIPSDMYTYPHPVIIVCSVNFKSCLSWEKEEPMFTLATLFAVTDSFDPTVYLKFYMNNSL